MVHAALLLLMLEAVTTDLVSTISLKRSTQNLQLSTSSPADYPIYRIGNPLKRLRRANSGRGAMQVGQLSAWELRGEAQRRRVQSSKQMVLGRLVCTGRSRICRIQFLKLLRIKCQ